ncbi:hypothetical protein J3998_06345 [Thiomicrorhabdus sp. 6S2-11]|uniref:Phage protein n=1 Tax=Thiomicrorhabdus marina TaxID=2818442 RepID=A0ABS3Q4E1_9GAMM|nr:DUF6172 family protein [Thiomicrorhabdus marina]MBO1927193.1 hypothetical protein [Thiomicrorhabdus marina]
MKKTFQLTHEKIQPARLTDAIKHEVKKYIKRERRLALPADADFWAFKCKYGATADDCIEIHEAEINKYIDKSLADNLTSFYLEVIAQPATRSKRPETYQDANDDFDDDFDDE